MFELVLLIGVVFAARSAWNHATQAAAKSRSEKLEAAEKKSGAPLSRPRQQMTARQHDVGWWASEAAHGFPVIGTGWHAGWLAHKSAAVQAKHKREEARTTHAEVRAGFAAAMAAHRQRQAEALGQIMPQIDDPAAGREAVEEVAGNVLPFVQPKPMPVPRDPRPKGSQKGTVKRGPYAPEPEPACSACGHPGRPGDQLLPTPEGWQVHQSHFNDPSGGFYQPPSPEGNHSMPTGTATASDVTYDEQQREMTKVAVKIEAAINDIRFEQMQNQVEQVAAVVSDSDTLGALSDNADQLQRAKEAMQRALESTLNTKSVLKRNHGGMNEAHQSAPVKGAQPEYYEG